MTNTSEYKKAQHQEERGNNDNEFVIGRIDPVHKCKQRFWNSQTCNSQKFAFDQTPNPMPCNPLTPKPCNAIGTMFTLPPFESTVDAPLSHAMLTLIS